jgi:hypothetical protein
MLSMVRLIATLFILLGISVAGAHDSWISRNRLTDPQSGQWCCNHIDCEGQKNGDIREVQGGYLVAATGEVIPYARVIWKSEDGSWWRCRNMQTNATRCLIGPPPGS